MNYKYNFFCFYLIESFQITQTKDDILIKHGNKKMNVYKKLRNSLATSRGLLPLRASLRQPGRPRVLLTSFSRGGGPAQPTLCPAQKKFWRSGRREPRQLSTSCRPDSIDLMDPLMVRWATGDPPKPPHRVSNLPPLARIRRFERLCKPGFAKLTTNALHRLI